MNARTHTELIQDTPLIKLGTRIVADSCSVIFLNRLSLLEAYADIHRMLLTQMVYDEVTSQHQGADAAEDTSLYKKLRTSGTISVHTTEAYPSPMRASLSVADLTLITAFNTYKPDGILTDDKSLCQYCRKHSIPYINTPMALFVLLYHKAISHNQYLNKLEALYETGRYGKFIHEYMRELYNNYCRRTNRTN